MQGVLEFLEDSLEPVIILTCTDPSPPPPPWQGVLEFPEDSGDDELLYGPGLLPSRNQMA